MKKSLRFCASFCCCCRGFKEFVDGAVPVPASCEFDRREVAGFSCILGGGGGCRYIDFWQSRSVRGIIIEHAMAVAM